MLHEVKQYIQAADDQRQPQLRELRGLILAELPGVTEGFEWGFPVYYHGEDPIAGFANRSKCVMFYIMQSAIVDRHRQELGKLASGKSCIEYRASREVPIERVHEIVLDMLRELKKQRKLK